MTKNQQSTVRMSLLPLIIILVMIVSGGYLLFQGELGNLAKLLNPNKEPSIRRLENFPTVVPTDKVTAKKRLILKSKEELNEFLNAVDSSGILVLKENIDFNKEYLIAVSSELHDESGHTTRIKRVYSEKERNKLIVHIDETEKGKGCEVDLDKNLTVDIVAISKTDSEFYFEKFKRVDDCLKDVDIPEVIKD